PWGDGRFHGVVVARRHLERLHAEPREVLVAELAAAVVTLVEEYDLVARVELGHQESDDGGHAARVEEGFLGPFERGQLTLDHLLSWAPIPPILLARLVVLDEVDNRLGVAESVGRRAKDRVGDGVTRLLPRLSGVNGDCRHPPSFGRTSPVGSFERSQIALLDSFQVEALHTHPSFNG